MAKVRSLFTIALMILLAAPRLLADPAPLRVAISGSYMPLHGMSGSEPVGFEVDLARLIARELGRPLEIVDTRRTLKMGAIEAIVAGKVDLGMSSITPTEERRKSVDFTRPYLEIAYGLAGRTSLHQKPSESTARVGVPSPAAKAAVAAFMPKATLYECNSLEACVLFTAQGAYDYFAEEVVALQLTVQRRTDLELLEHTFGSSPLAIATAKGQSGRIDEALSKLAPQIRDIETKWKPGQRWYPADVEALLASLPPHLIALENHQGRLVRTSYCDSAEVEISLKRSRAGWTLGLVLGQDGEAFDVQGASRAGKDGVRVDALPRYAEPKPKTFTFKPTAGKGRWRCEECVARSEEFVDARLSTFPVIVMDPESRGPDGSCGGGE